MKARFEKLTLPMIIGGVILLGCISLFVGQNLFFQLGVRAGVFAPNPIRQFPAMSEEAPAWYAVYFTNPACPPERRRRNGIDELIAEDIRQAATAVDLAAYELNARPIISALEAVARSGIPVRVVVDSDETDDDVINRLSRAGIAVVGDQRSALMHNKFVVIDDAIVWTGSINYTENGSYCNANNAVRFESPLLAENYRLEMDEMVVQQSFGPTSPDNTQHAIQTIEGVVIENYFGAERELAPIIAAAIEAAEDEIRFMAYSFTEATIGDAVMAQAQAGTAVQGVFETTGSQTEYSFYTPLKEMRAANVRVRQDGQSAVMHHKVFILDRKLVIFGSFNFTNSANDENDENVVLVHDPEFAAQFSAEFDAVWRKAPGLADLFREWLTIR
jgi:phosphatidylserine/phosphatidylglycerophosphate/cardiolipin synthase-like enzyme